MTVRMEKKANGALQSPVRFRNISAGAVTFDTVATSDEEVDG